MNLFFHHVGGPGSGRDFPRTVYSKVGIETVGNAVPDDHVHREYLLSRLEEEFPEGYFNVWGVPEGARSVIENLTEGDAVLLIASAGFHGSVPALGIVRIFIPARFLDLSKALWGEERFPLVFFFETERLTYSWAAFTEDLDYKSNWNPAGMFFRAGSHKMEKWGGVEGYLAHVRASHAIEEGQ